MGWWTETRLRSQKGRSERAKEMRPCRKGWRVQWFPGCYIMADKSNGISRVFAALPWYSWYSWSPSFWLPSIVCRLNNRSALQQACTRRRVEGVNGEKRRWLKGGAFVTDYSYGWLGIVAGVGVLCQDPRTTSDSKGGTAGSLAVCWRLATGPSYVPTTPPIPATSAVCRVVAQDLPSTCPQNQLPLPILGDDGQSPRRLSFKIGSTGLLCMYIDNNH
jgi:hypothetical protein